MFAGRPAGRACWNVAISPALAASYMRAARARASGGREPVESLMMPTVPSLLWCIFVFAMEAQVDVVKDQISVACNMAVPLEITFK